MRASSPKKLVLMTSLLAVSVRCAPPIEPDPAPTPTPPLPPSPPPPPPNPNPAPDTAATPNPVTVVGSNVNSLTISIIPAGTHAIRNTEHTNNKILTTETAITEGIPTTTTTRSTAVKVSPQLPALVRKALLSHLTVYDLQHLDPLLLSHRQRQAILQELRHQQQGLPPFTDPSPWQTLSRNQQEEFNRKYLLLRKDLQEFSRNQFLTLPPDRQVYAYQAFLNLDIQTLSEAIERELAREYEAFQPETNARAYQQSSKNLSSFKKESQSGKNNNEYAVQGASEYHNSIENRDLSKNIRIAADLKTQEKEDKLGQKHILAEQVRLYNLQQNLNERPGPEDSEEFGSTEIDQQRQEVINKLFEIALSEEQNAGEEKPPTKSNASPNILNDISNKPSLSVQKSLQSKLEVKDAKSSYKQRKSSGFSVKYAHRLLPSSLRELQRKQKRKNLMRLNFDPRRRH